MPGHVTKDGFKINDGDCPFYALLKSKTEAKDPAVEEETPRAGRPGTRGTRDTQESNPTARDESIARFVVGMIYLK
nr:hypothetical protein [Candidatus Sigynarchaeota archaeon]